MNPPVQGKAHRLVFRGKDRVGKVAGLPGIVRPVDEQSDRWFHELIPQPGEHRGAIGRAFD